MSEAFVWLDGQLVPASEATVSVFDKGFLAGDGVFETIKVVNGQPFALSRHLRRLGQSATAVDLQPPSTSRLAAAVAEVIKANSAIASFARLRITLTASSAELTTAGRRNGANVVVTVEAQQPHVSAARLVTAPWPHNDRGPLVGAKTTSYADNLAVLRWARSQGADEAVMADTRGRLCEATTANIIVADGAELVTPTLATGCLGGITRDLLIEWGIVVERDCSIDVLSVAPEILIASSTRDLIPACQIDGRELVSPGPLSRQAMSEFARLARENPDP